MPMRNPIRFPWLFVLLAAVVTSPVEGTKFYLTSGEVREAVFVLMKDNVIYVRIPRPGGGEAKKAFHKRLFSRVELDDGGTLDLSLSNSPPELNHRRAQVPFKEHDSYEKGDGADDFGTMALEIAVNNLTASGLSDYEAVTLTDILRAELGSTGAYQVMERAKMDEILREQGFQQSGACSEATCLVEMGQLLGVRHVVVGNVGLVGKTYSINVRIVDVKTGRILREVSELHRGTKDRLLSHVMPAVARKLAGTYEKKKTGRVLLIGAGIAAAAAAVPAVLILTREEESGEPGGGAEEPTTDIEIRWNTD